MRLNLGCGDDIKDGYVNVDITKLPGVDVLADLNDPLPLKSESVDQIVMKSVLEHLNQTEKVMRELFRILKAGGSLRITAYHMPIHQTSCETLHTRTFLPSRHLTTL